MKKIVSATCLAALAPLAQADTILGVYAGVGIWQADYGGDTGVDSIDLDELGLDDEDNNFFYVALEHPVPLLPNIKLQNTNVESEASATLTRDFTLDDVTFTATDSVVTDLDLSHTDVVLYYEILDNWVTLDLGMTLRAFDGEASVRSENTDRSETVDLDAVLPMAYAKAQFDLPFTGFSVGADANIITYDGNTLSDASAKVAYAYESLVVDVGFELGYRRMALSLDDLDDLEADITLDGPYAAITLHF
ncbi:TIGR04219 family outer membrane beta-barrel protein [Exilibacterium tricleocarpae]|uniref:TIGR04219 family outer membrane beta-barrel protein n=1 Tax=Exilibacterium tricleocarpae TaxID=2591008 RepID=A0A545SRT8_9GAMM|nr:TIGR04219 family outer membrane beta-barrel protein [Exilibacterium tricleocarpae]TQV67684.1 TIGR04219 family outer membrane beta-barrel protein [Exilibacterium tricleocarpae]